MRSCTLLITIAFLTCSVSVTEAVCVGHFNNRSNYQWSSSGYDRDKGSMIIAPNTSADIPWAAATTVVISGAITGRAYTRQFEVHPAGD